MQMRELGNQRHIQPPEVDGRAGRHALLGKVVAIVSLFRPRSA